MPSPYDKMTLADLKAELDKRVQSLVGLVDAHRPLHGHPLSRAALCGKTVRVGLALQVFPALVERSAVLGKALGHAEQLEIIGLQVHGIQ